MTPSFSRRLLFPLFSLLAVTCCSCMETPQEKLIGRWFNRDNSIRFREDGVVIWNARSQRAYGRYWYTGEARDLSTGKPRPNMTIQLVTPSGERLAQYEAQFLGTDKLRMQSANRDSSNNDVVRGQFVLTKAESDDVLTSELASR